MMTLRKLLTLAVFAFAMLVLMGAISLVWSTTLQRVQTDAMLREFDHARLVNRIELSLFQFRYRDRLWASTGREEHFQFRQEAEKELWDAYGALRENAGEGPFAQRIKDLEPEMTAFFRQLEVLHHSFDPDVSRVYSAVEPLIEGLQSRLEALVDDFRVSVEASQATALDMDHKMNIAGFVLGLVALLLSFTTVWQLWSRLYLPVLNLRNQMDRFARGERTLRSDISSPREFADIAATFNVMADSLEAKRAAQLRFISAVAHDLRNPLSSMKLYAQLYRPSRPLPEEAKIRKAFAVIESQVDRLSRMTTDLLDATRIEAGELELQIEVVDLVQIAREVNSVLEESSPRHQLELQTPVPLEVAGDATRLYQVFMNLVNNAIKYSPGGGKVLVRVFKLDQEARISVTDEGIGIAPGELNQIFEPFRRSGSVKQNIPGVGLGLSVTRRIIEAHGGRIAVESTLEQGSTFTVSLPTGRMEELSQDVSSPVRPLENTGS